MHFSLLFFPLLAQSVLCGVLPQIGSSNARKDTARVPEAQPDTKHHLGARTPPCPPVSSLVAKIEAFGATSKSSSVFYSGFSTLPQGYYTAKQVATKLNGGNAILYDKSLSDNDYRSFASPGGGITGAEIDQRTNAISAAFAQGSKGTAYVVVPDGSQFRAGSTWMDYEWPNLVSNKAIQEVIKIQYPSMTETTVYAVHFPDGHGGIADGIPKGTYPPAGADTKVFTNP